VVFPAARGPTSEMAGKDKSSSSSSPSTILGTYRSLTRSGVPVSRTSKYLFPADVTASFPQPGNVYASPSVATTIDATSRRLVARETRTRHPAMADPVRAHLHHHPHRIPDLVADGTRDWARLVIVVY